MALSSHDEKENGPARANSSAAYSMLQETQKALERLLQVAKCQIPSECKELITGTTFTTANTGTPDFPCPFKETEATGALKAVEAGIATAIANLRYGEQPRKAVVDLERASCFLFSTYVATVGGYDKGNPKSRSLLKDTDLLQAQSNPYRRLSANLYQTKNPGEYFHIHGSLEATTTLNMIGLPGFLPETPSYRDSIDLIEKHVEQHTASELEVMNAERKQAGVTCMKPEEFKATEHGQILSSEPPWRIDTLESDSPPAPFPPAPTSIDTPKPQILTGIKVLELCRIIAGPSIGRGLAEYGASVIKVTSPDLSDVPFFQVDLNMGKHAVDLDLKNPADRETFEALLEEADVVLDGYRPGSLERLGYGPKQLVELTKHRAKGVIYVAEDCFGHVGPWAGRPGWQQIADCVTGVAWEQGWFMGLDEPIVPPFPMSDYGTGCMGTIAALTALYKRAKYGGSYGGVTSLAQYDIFLLSLGLYPEDVQKRLREMHDGAFFELRHHDSVDEVGKRALKSMRRCHPELFEERHFGESFSQGYNARVTFVKPVVQIGGTWNGWVRQTRPNGFDQPRWEGWEFEKEMLD